VTSHHPVSSAAVTAGSGASRLLRRIGVLIPLLGAILVGLLQIRAPQPAGIEAPSDTFSAARAMQKLIVIAEQPRPIGSSAHDEVRDYLLKELQSLGLNPEVQRTTLDSVRGRGGETAVENILARIPGTDNSKAVMISAHYDSVPDSPGAADDGAAVAAMLETVRAIQASAPLKNDLILLLTDGEETGLLGAKAFVNEHPWAKDVGLVLNFEARGNKGPSLMFETSDGNGWLIREFIRAAPQPLAYSLIYNVYKLLPNDTDLSAFRASGLSGLNFAFGMGLNAYHSEIDTPDNLDRSSLQHHGDYMLSLARHFGQLDLNNVKQQDRVYFNVFGWKMISYPESWAMGWMLLGVLLFVATVWHGLRRKRVTLKGLGGGFLLSLLSLVAVFGAITLVWSIVRASVSRSVYISILEDPGVGTPIFIGLLALMLLIVILLIRLISRFIRTENLWMGTLLLWTLLCVGTTMYLPGGSYLFTWPLLFSLIGLNVCYTMGDGASKWASVLSAVPGFLLFTPILYLVFVMMTLDMANALLTISALACTLIYPLFYSRKRSFS